VDLFNCDERVRDGMLHTLDEELAEVTLWGDYCPPELEHRVESVSHQLSAAAQAFKAQALAVSGAPKGGPVSLEMFRSSGGLQTLPSSDLAPARQLPAWTGE
jgi:hypothetical protein